MLKFMIRKYKGFIRRIRKVILPIYYKMNIPKYGLNVSNNRDKKIILSLTSYPNRFGNLDLCIKSLLNQSFKPDKLILYLDDTVQDKEITDNILELRKYGLEIYKRPENIKPHKKYYYALKEYPDDIVITVDDDMIYDRNLIKRLIKSYNKYPKAVSAMRVHKIVTDEFGRLKSYNNWENEYDMIVTPSMQLLATGVGGVLYPPHCMNKEVFNLDNIKKLCLEADDIWLKYMQILNNTPVVFVKSNFIRPTTIDNTQEFALHKTNVLENQNDKFIKQMSENYNINLSDFIILQTN
ncbi:hypothetical protein CCS79_12470 [Clostridium diolis]|uniref:glycosyltransferase n=1 Tax=Clostridium diolis TaxID=223919 RepID=UPI000B3F6A24|nr:glycosyltransferase [Clostridium diolis]OVE67764.1 hypothetical protein CCS79_12470 [Clostridium diolis]